MDPGIDRRSGLIFERIDTHHSWHSYDLEGSGGIMRFCFGDTEWGKRGGGGK